MAAKKLKTKVVHEWIGETLTNIDCADDRSCGMCAGEKTVDSAAPGKTIIVRTQTKSGNYSEVIVCKCGMVTQKKWHRDDTSYHSPVMIGTC